MGSSEAAAGAKGILSKVGHSNVWQGEAEVIQVWCAQAPATDAACSGTARKHEGMASVSIRPARGGGVWAAGHALHDPPCSRQPVCYSYCIAGQAHLLRRRWAALLGRRAA